EGSVGEAEALGKKLADMLKGQGAQEILDEIFEQHRPEA
ncbi:MAG: hydroxymethylbilane synthase, partial [Cyanobacteria bacterium P01_F01_bin.42]